MSLDRRLQLLLDEPRYALVSAEAERSGRSVAAVIREAIDQRFNDGVAVRAEAGRRLLAIEPGAGSEPDWADTKRALEREIDRY